MKLSFNDLRIRRDEFENDPDIHTLHRLVETSQETGDLDELWQFICGIAKTVHELRNAVQERGRSTARDLNDLRSLLLPVRRFADRFMGKARDEAHFEAQKVMYVRLQSIFHPDDIRAIGADRCKAADGLHGQVDFLLHMRVLRPEVPVACVATETTKPRARR